MRDVLLDLYTRSPRTFGQKLKSKAYTDLYSWFIKETAHIDETSLKGKAFIYLFEPDMSCPYGESKKFSQGKIRYCGKLGACRCHTESLTKVHTDNSPWSDPGKKKNILVRRTKTCQERYGVDNVLQLPDVIEKQKSAVKAIDQTKHSKMKQDVGYGAVIERVADYVRPLFTVEEYRGCARHNVYTWQCSTCANEFESHVDNGYTPRCLICHPYTTSQFEQEIYNFIVSLGVECVTRTKEIIFPKEIDIYIPSKDIAIECNGTYWHSTFKKSDKYYHINKTLDCAKQGIQLIHIFENDWTTHSEIVKSRIKNMLGLSNRIYARKTTVLEINNTEAKAFTSKHHLRGWASSSVSYGLYVSDTLVAVMTFGKNRYDKLTEWELIRYCSDGQVIGGASKLLKRFIIDYRPKSICSFADRCWSNGKLYRALGFTDVTSDEKNIGYYYVKRSKRMHRSSFTKGKLIELGYDPTLTEEHIVTKLMGLFKIYDCGNSKFVLDIPENT